jgi:signal transduction histidine kinase
VRSRSKSSGGSVSTDVARVPDGGRAGNGNGNGAVALAPAAFGEGAPAAPDAAAGPGESGGQPTAAPPSGSRRALKNWRVRSRLVMLVSIPTVAAVALGGFRIASSVQSAVAYQRVDKLASLYQKSSQLVQALQQEREETVRFIVLGTNGGRAASVKNAAPELAVLKQDASATTAAAGQVSTQLGSIDSSYPKLAQQDAAGAQAAISGLPALRAAATHTQLPALVVIQKYSDAISALMALDDQVATSSNDSTLADTVRVSSLVSQIKEEASQQQAVLTSALGTDLVGLNEFGPAQLAAFNNAQAEQLGNENELRAAATPAQQQQFNNALQGTPATAKAEAQELQAIQESSSGRGAGSSDPTVADAVSGATSVVGSLGGAEKQLVSSVIDRSQTLRRSAITSLIVDSVVVLIVLALAMVLITLVGRSLVRPLRRLRTGALEIAGLHLPEAVRRMSETDGEDVSVLEVEPIAVDSSDEIGEVARAFDQVHREALRLAATEAALRGNVNAMFVNLSRRSQSLVERQIHLIDDLEQGEQDAERLSSLFRMDHLATLMRRNSENLLVLAGHDSSRRWNQPVAVVDVLRAAVSEIEQYERVTLNVQPGIAVRGQAVSDVVHLTAELVENATSFSAADTPVSIVGHLLSSGGVLVEISDQGVGMGAEEMAHANWRLDNPPTVDVAVSRRMGLFVVARLAARHGIRVRLRAGDSSGLTALVWLPDEVVTEERAGAIPGLGRFDGRMPADFTDLGNGAADWPQGDRAATEHEVNAARAPRFAPLAGDPAAAGSGLWPRRVPGAGPRPGAVPRTASAATGPLPVFRTTPSPAGPPFDQEADGTAPQPAVDAGVADERVADLIAGDARDQTAMPIASQPAAEVEQSPATPLAAAGQAGSGFAASTGFQPSLGSSAGRPADYRLGRSALTGSPGDVIVPSSAALGQENRLPIFEAVESDWFRRGGQAVSWTGKARLTPSGAGSQVGAGASGATSAPQAQMSNGGSDAGGGYAAAADNAGSWSSPADEGWRAAAAAASAPSTAGVTPAGLPKRVPQANLVPGTAADVSAPTPARSAAATRDRLASFQRGIRRGRAVASGDDKPGSEEDGSS